MSADYGDLTLHRETVASNDLYRVDYTIEVEGYYVFVYKKSKEVWHSERLSHGKARDVLIQKMSEYIGGKQGKLEL